MNEEIQTQVTESSQLIQSLIAETQKVIIGQDRLMRNLVIALLARWHIILEWVPWLAKTLSIQTLGQVIWVDFSRVQFTPDLLPSDLIGVQIWNQKSNEFVTKQWPIFAHLVLADEINRAPAKVQSALLEAMAERQVTIWDESYQLDPPFVVMATMNPVEQEGTYSLPEAQLDRFLLKTVISYPSESEEIQIMKRFAATDSVAEITEILPHEHILDIQKLVDQIHVSDNIYNYVKDIVVATRKPKEKWFDSLADYIQYGASPRASLALITCAKVMALIYGRTFVIPEDIQEIIEDVLQHRLILSFDAIADGVSVQQIIAEVVKSVSVF